ncbi:MAG: YihY/virulence factor BrkB family protein [Flavobacteriales bacterium]|nr:YihY/virulence factor BrkB family protein [Flavobacteriales bacterium]
MKIPGLEGLSVYDFLKLYTVGILNGTIPARASSIAFSFFMAVFPFTLFILALIPFIPIDGFQDYLFSTLRNILPADTFRAVDSTINDIINIRHGNLLSVGFIMAAILTTNGVNAVISGLTTRSDYYAMELRGVVSQYLISLSLTFMLVLLLMFSVGVIIGSEVLLHSFDSIDYLKNHVPLMIEIGRSLITLGVLFFSVSLIFYYGPKNNQNWKFISPGAFLTTILIVVVSYLFGLYITHFGQYNKLYGSIGTLLVIMIWIYINSIILLIGFELNASIWNLKHQAKLLTLSRKKEGTV